MGSIRFDEGIQHSISVEKVTVDLNIQSQICEKEKQRNGKIILDIPCITCLIEYRMS
jgi:hypothetical protein